MKNLYMKLALVPVLALALAGCNSGEDERLFDNKIYIDVANPVGEVLFLTQETEIVETREVKVGTAMPVENEVKGKFVFDPSLLTKYNMSYGQTAELIDAAMVNIAAPEVSIEIGAVESLPVTVEFKGINVLDRKKVYVAPIALVDVQGIDVLNSKTVVYFVFKGASLINVVADIRDNFFPVTWKSNVNGLQAITFETLLRARTFGAAGGDNKSFISTIFGIEGNFLIRIGDASFPDNQVQVVAPGGNFPSKNPALGLPTNEWVHIAVVYDSSTGSRILYQNGEKVYEDAGARSSLSLSSNCYVGYSYEATRWFDGEVAEMRLWNKVRTAEEIKNNVYTVDPASEGLITYWKFNEGAGAKITDHTGHGNDITANGTLGWTSVSLPE